MAEFFETSDGGIGIKMGDKQGVEFARGAGGVVAISLIEAGDIPGIINVTRCFVTDIQWREIIEKVGEPTR